MFTGCPGLRPRTKPSGPQGPEPRALASAPRSFRMVGAENSTSLPHCPPFFPHFHILPSTGAVGLAATHASFSALLETNTSVSAFWSPRHSLSKSHGGLGGWGHSPGTTFICSAPLLSRRAAAFPGRTGAVLSSGVGVYLVGEGFWRCGGGCTFTTVRILGTGDSK